MSTSGDITCFTQALPRDWKGKKCELTLSSGKSYIVTLRDWGEFYIWAEWTGQKLDIYFNPSSVASIVCLDSNEEERSK